MEARAWNRGPWLCWPRWPRSLVTRQELLADIWPGGEVSDEALAQCVYQLRQQLPATGGEDYRKLISTIPKRGWLNAEFQRGRLGRNLADERYIVARLDITIGLEDNYTADYGNARQYWLDVSYRFN